MPFADLGGLTATYRIDGPNHAPALVLLNSLGTDYRIWDGVVSAMGGRFRTLRYDARGQGLTDSPPGPYRMADHSGDLLRLLDGLDWGPTALCGLSIGGMIAMDACLRRPAAVTGLVLADTAAAIGPREFWDDRMRLALEEGMSSIAGPAMLRWFGTAFRRERPTDVRGWSNLLARAPIPGYLGSCAALRDCDLTESVAEIDVPAACLCGSEDVATPPSAVRALASRLPDASYSEIKGAGHLTPVEQPQEFARIVTQFMEERLAV